MTISSYVYFALAIDHRPQADNPNAELFDSLRGQFSAGDARRVLESRGEALLAATAEVIQRAKNIQARQLVRS